MTASITARARQAVGAGADGGGVGFDDAARPFAVDDAHDDGARLRAGELGDDRDPEPADVKRHRHQEAVLLLGEVGRPQAAPTAPRAAANEYG